MSITQEQINNINTRLGQAIAERSEAEKQANTFEQAARAERLKMQSLKEEIATLRTSLEHAVVAKAAVDSAQAAEKAKKEAEAAAIENARLTAELEAKNKAADELIAKLTAQTEVGEKKAD